MNIFALSTDPTLAAEYLCDQHINKMLLESTQLLCTAVDLLFKQIGGSPPATNLYKPTHQSHPCTLWLLESKANCDWLYQYVQELEAERQDRFGERVPHQSRLVAAQAHFCLSHPALSPRWKAMQLTPFRQAMPLQLQQVSNDESTGEAPYFKDAVDAYRAYYNYKNDWWIADGKQPMKWTNRPEPHFMTGKEQVL